MVIMSFLMGRWYCGTSNGRGKCTHNSIEFTCGSDDPKILPGRFPPGIASIGIYITAGEDLWGASSETDHTGWFRCFICEILMRKLGGICGRGR